MAKCWNCGARIWWAYTVKNGKKTPVDWEPSPGGNVVVERVERDGDGRRVPFIRTLTGPEMKAPVGLFAEEAPPGEPAPSGAGVPGPDVRFKVHRATCPKRHMWSDADKRRA